MYAVFEESIDMVKLLVKAGADVNIICDICVFKNICIIV